MQKSYIDKLAFIDIHDRKVLTTLSKGKDIWYIPGGNREELSIDLTPETIILYGSLNASAEIAECRYVSYLWREKSSPVDKIIFDDLKAKGLIE
jgi:hypothetical protein